MSFYRGPKIVTRGLIMLLDAADANSRPGSGTIYTDISGRGNNGTLTNGPVYTSINNGAITLDGTNDYITVSSISSSAFASGFTWAGWAKTTAFSSGWMWPFGTSAGDWLQLGKISGGGGVRFDAATGLYSGAALDTTGVNIADGIWHYIVGVWDMQFRYIYIDGVLNASVASTPGASPGIYGTMYLGCHPGPAEFWNGQLGQMKIYTSALTAPEVSQNFKALRGRYSV